MKLPGRSATMRTCSSTYSSTAGPTRPRPAPVSWSTPGRPGCSRSRGRTTCSCRWRRPRRRASPADLMTNVAIAMPRSPMHLANAAWDLQLMSGGRFRLGLGSQIKPHIEKRYGATWSPPAARMREIVLAVKAILASWQDGTRLDFRGEHTQHTLMPPTFVPGPNPFGPPPVLLGALGPVMTRTAAEVADGLLVMPFHSHRHVRRTHAAGGGRGPVAGRPVEPSRSRSTPRRSWPWGGPRPSSRPPRSGCAGCSRSTAPPRRTAPSSTSRAGATCSRSSTRSPRPATSWR